MAVKYSIQYKNSVGDDFQILILNDDYTDEVINVRGSAVLTKPKTKPLHCLRGKALRIDLEANKDLEFTDLYSEKETDFKVVFYRNNKVIFTGFILPDGIYSDWVRDRWIISLDCVDGLGILKNLRFVKPGGTHFSGIMKEIDIIKHCLARTTLDLTINTAINVFHDGVEDFNLDVLDNTKLNVQRFLKDVSTDSDKAIMDCEEVLKSVLEKYNAVIEQFDGKWFIYRPSELLHAKSGVNVSKERFHSYQQGYYIGFDYLNKYKYIGSHIDEDYPHHANENQRIKISGAVSAFRVKYRYGFVKSFIDNINFRRDLDTISIPNWIENGDHLYESFIIDENGYINKGLRWNASEVVEKNTYEIKLKNPINVKEGDVLNISGIFTSKGFISNLPVRAYVQTSQGVWELQDNGYPKYEDFYENSWIINDQIPFQIENTEVRTFTQGIPAQQWSEIPTGTGTIEYSYDFIMPADGQFFLEIFPPVKAGWALATPPEDDENFAELHSLKISSVSDIENREEENWTAYRKPANSSNVEDSKEVHNGDMRSDIYVGAIKKLNGDNTTFWRRINRNEEKPLLKIMAEDRIRLQNRPQKVFSGDVFGYVPELSIISIRNIGNNFYPLAYSYDTLNNICNFEMIELFNDELDGEITTELTYERGNVTKPTIEE